MAHSDYLTEEQLTLLYERSIEIRKPTEDLLPCQPSAYWNRIRNHYDGFMIPHRKDFNGTPKPAINGNILGLFFNASLHRTTKKPIGFSYFGNQCLMVNSSFIFNIHQNIYFVDFYCHNLLNHYVTLVAARPGSVFDNFCQRNLKQINIFNNPFLKIVNGKLCVTLGVNVEVFYTDSVDVNQVIYEGIGKFSSPITFQVKGSKNFPKTFTVKPVT
jgi:hypothetical protein